MTRASRNVSLTQDHCDLIARVARERRLRFSEALRVIIDFAIDRDATLGLPFHAERVKSLQAELSTAQEAIKSLEEQQKKAIPRNNSVFEQVDSPRQVKSTVFANPTGPGDAPKPSFVDKRLGQTAEERWRVKLGYVLNPPAHLSMEDIEKVSASVAGLAERNPEWVDRLSFAEQTALSTKLRLTEPESECQQLAPAQAESLGSG